MKGINKRKWIRGLQITLAVYCTAAVVLWQLQDELLFHPTPLPADYQFQFRPPFHEVTVQLTVKDQLNMVQFLPNPDSTARGIVLYFHGNKENIKRYAPYADLFTTAGYEVWMIDYPGYGKSTGKLTEQRLYNDADIVYKMAAQRINSDSIVIYGKSLGTGIATELASRRSCKQLILETPYYSIRHLAAFHFPVFPAQRMIRYSFPTYVFLANVRAPVTVFHGTSDVIIPYAHAQKLKSILKPRDRFITIEGGKHNDLPEYSQYQQIMNGLLRH